MFYEILKNENLRGYSNTPQNIPQNVGPNELCLHCSFGLFCSLVKMQKNQ
jgi:hypothetical protein